MKIHLLPAFSCLLLTIPNSVPAQAPNGPGMVPAIRHNPDPRPLTVNNVQVNLGGSPPLPPPTIGGGPVPPPPMGGGSPPPNNPAPPNNGGNPPPPPPPPPPQGPQLGDPLPGLTDQQLQDFAIGRAEFENVEDEASGLGPVFNGVSCVSCHSSGATGGASAVTVIRFGRNLNGLYDPLAALGGSLLQQRAIDVGALENIPVEANVIAHRQATALFGLGLIEGISDADILRNAQRPVVDGIKGHAALVTDVVSGTQRVGRFGWKAQVATVLAFSADAYLNEMGITNRFFPTENAPNGDLAKLAAFDHVADPEDQADPVTGKSDIDTNADFMRFLAPPPVRPPTTSSNAGRQLFQTLNCATCHVPTMFTGPSPIVALNQKPVPLFSDLLLHDMGMLGDGIVQGAAGAREMRTPPLWGLRASAPYLHDGRAATLDEAISGHDGEAKSSRDRYLRLTPTQKQQLFDFLNSI